MHRFIAESIRNVLYVLSLALAIILAGICAIHFLHFLHFFDDNSYFFDYDLWREAWKRAEDMGLYPTGGLYISYAIFFLTALMHFWRRYEKAQFMARIHDRNYVLSLVEDGKQALERLSDKPVSAENSEEPSGEPENISGGPQSAKDNSDTHCRALKSSLRKVIKNLKKKLKSDEAIVEYDLLALKTLLVDCANEHAVPAQARVYLTDLKSYADQETHTQTVEEYWDIRHRIEETEKKIYAQHYYYDAHTSDLDKQKKKVPAVTELRELVKEELLPTLTDNEKLWSEGFAIVKTLRGACLAAIPLLLATGLIPMYMGEVCMLSGIHWAILGVAGALVAVLRSLGTADRLVVGDEQGMREVQRAWWGAGLGLVAGLLTYMLVKSGFISCFLFGGPCVPGNMEDQILISGCFLEQVGKHQIYVHMLLAFLAGFAFERGIDRVRAVAGS